MRVPGALPDAKIVAPVIANNGKVAFGENKYDSRVRGTVPEYRNLNDAKLVFGNYIDETQTQSNSRVAVLGDVPYRKLFPDGSDPTGTEIRINNISFQVIGVLAKWQTPNT
jgi:putative ABC transport system permease protein